jgi:hypothetical protein
MEPRQASRQWGEGSTLCTCTPLPQFSSPRKFHHIAWAAELETKICCGSYLGHGGTSFELSDVNTQEGTAVVLAAAVAVTAGACICIHLRICTSQLTHTYIPLYVHLGCTRAAGAGTGTFKVATNKVANFAAGERNTTV